MNRALFTSHYTLITIAIVVTAFLQHTDELKVYTLLILLYTALDTVYYQFSSQTSSVPQGMVSSATGTSCHLFVPTI